MSSESLSCLRCGSEDVQEVKPGTYFCNQCDNVFKYVSPHQAGSTGGCELPVVGRSCCGIPAIGRCKTCSRAYCPTHQARNLSTIGLVIQTYLDWCSECQQQHKDDERTLAESREKRQEAERSTAAERILVLIAQFKAQPFTGARSRDYVERVAAGRAFLSGAIRYKSVTHRYEAAVPLGRLYWTYYVASGEWYDKPSRQSQEWATGLTRNGEFVPMETSILHDSFIALGLGYQLASSQEVKICEYLELLLDKTGQATEESVTGDTRYNLTADGKVNYADPK